MNGQEERNLEFDCISFFSFIFQISMMSKLVPSPDWFVGLDSLDLCENGRFIDTLTIEVFLFPPEVFKQIYKLLAQTHILPLLKLK